MPQLVTLATAVIAVAGCIGNASVSESPSATVGAVASPLPTASVDLASLLATDAAGSSPSPACVSQPDRALCQRAVDAAFAAARFSHTATDAYVHSLTCSRVGCAARVEIIAPDGFSSIVELTAGTPNEPWEVVSVSPPGAP